DGAGIDHFRVRSPAGKPAVESGPDAVGRRDLQQAGVGQRRVEAVDGAVADFEGAVQRGPVVADTDRSTIEQADLAGTGQGRGVVAREGTAGAQIDLGSV